MQDASGRPTASSVEVVLPPREFECLEWPSRGKLASEIGIILGISERTVEQCPIELGVRMPSC
nr:LuxR C-terminal-related transcriptional regulator [Bradyrhizobium tropiciagri]